MAIHPRHLPASRAICAFLFTATLATAQHVEVEWNGGPDYADPIGSATTVAGVLESNLDSDWFRFTSPGTAYAITRNTAPWILYDTDGAMLHRSANAAGSSVTRSVYVPAGDHCLEVSSTSAANTPYTVDLLPLPTVITPLATGPNTGTTSIDAVGTQTFYSFTLPAPGRVVVARSIGTTIELLRDDGRLLWQRANLDIDLPAGNYLVRILHSAVAPCTITLTATAQPLHDLFLGNLEPVSIQVGGALRLFRLDLPAPCTPRIETYPQSSALTDTVLILYDRNLRVLAAGDDPVVSNYPARLEVPLPAGNYYVGALLFSQTAVGAFDVDADCSLPFPPLATGAYGANVVASPGSGVVGALAFDVCTPTSVTFTGTTTMSVPGLGIGSWWTIMDDSGLCTGVNGFDGYMNFPSPQGGGGVRSTRLPVGRSYLLVSREHWNAFHYDFIVTSPLACSIGQITTHGRPGDFSGLVFAFATWTPLDLGQYGISGFTCLDLSTLVVGGIQQYSAQGSAAWAPCPPTPYGIFMQHLDWFAPPPGPVFAAARDIVPF
ncbi:MAG: hypothetical protein U1E73_04205 [Planctomycetota bacterium]